MYLFDTDIVIAFLRKSRTSNVIKSFEDVPPYQQHLSTVSVSELVYGACRSKHPEYHLDQILNTLLPNIKILEFDAHAAWKAGELRANLAGRGQSIDFPDLQIASIAMSRNLTLVTGNVKHFSRISGLNIQNWKDKN